ncbi:hypothetical protein [Rubrivirga sp.]|uniref:hypothetical protein n=1 Tax=Rubrivirga sp. TaxID=1885344 RepID=UPI003C74A607
MSRLIAHGDPGGMRLVAREGTSLRRPGGAPRTLATPFGDLEDEGALPSPSAALENARPRRAWGDEQAR